RATSPPPALHAALPVSSGGSGPWARYASALAKYVEQSGVPPEHLGVSYTELGRVQSQVLKQIPQAIATLERGLAGNPAHVEMRRSEEHTAELQSPENLV